MNFGQLPGENHPGSCSSHLKEIRRQGGQTAEYELVERKVIVADKTYILAYGQAGIGHIPDQFRQFSVKAASGDEEKVPGLYI